MPILRWIGLQRVAMPSVFGIVLAGGEGKRLMPLTADRAKPAVPFGGHYRLIDFALSNLVNAGFLRIVVLTQYKSHSLDRHITTTWRLSPLLGNYVTPVPAQMRRGPWWFAGSADAIYQNLNLIYDERPDLVCVFGADHIYRMDPRQMIEQHIATGAGVTVAGIRVPIDQSSQFGVIETADDGITIERFREKPKTAKGLRDAPDQIYASMGNYVFSTQTLIDAVGADAHDEGSSHDLGGDIIPMLVEIGDGARLRLLRQRRARRLRARTGVLARRRDARHVLRHAHGSRLDAPRLQSLQPGVADPQLAGAAAAREVRRRGGGSHGPGDQLDGLRRRHRLGRARPPLGALTRRARPFVRRGRPVRAAARRRGRAQRRDPERDPRQERARRRRAPRSAST